MPKRRTPKETYKTKIFAGVIFVRSMSSWAMPESSPPARNTKSNFMAMLSPLFDALCEWKVFVLILAKFMDFYESCVFLVKKVNCAANVYGKIILPEKNKNSIGYFNQ